MVVPYLRYPTPGVPLRFVALVALVAFVALVAASALAAAGTFPRLHSRTSAPVSGFSFTFKPVMAPFAIFALVTAPLLIFGLVTAFFFSCFVPTLLFGSAVAA